jgi:hypothetical protein
VAGREGPGQKFFSFSLSVPLPPPPTFFSFSVCLALVWLSCRKNKQDNFLIVIFYLFKNRRHFVKIIQQLSLSIVDFNFMAATG